MKTPTHTWRIITLLFICQFVSPHNLLSETLHVGPGHPYSSLTEATDIAMPGDSIVVHEGTYNGGLYVEDLQGTSSDWIWIIAEEGEAVIFEGGNNAWQFTDAAYLHIKGFIFQHQSGNGLNFDDGGTYDSPTHHVIFENCIFRDMDASGNNDLLKLSGLDDFQVINCTFLNGAAGGSGIDMVGCHDGIIKNNHFENLGSNAIQAKGGTANIRIEANYFKNAGARALNLGGSTGLQFFRPIDAPYEAADLKVYSNTIIGSEASFAFVGSINCEVINNTIYLPTKWVFRILQETVDPDRFPPCGYNTLRNNIFFLDDRVTTEVNIGPNTAPETFTMSNNLWFQSDDSNWPGPDLPVEDVDNIVGEDPMFIKGEVEDFHLLENSPAIGAGYDVVDPEFDFDGNEYLSPRSIGAFEGGEVTGVKDIKEIGELVITPNPSNGHVQVAIPEELRGKEFEIIVSDVLGRNEIISVSTSNEILIIDPAILNPGLLFLQIRHRDHHYQGKVIVH